MKNIKSHFEMHSRFRNGIFLLLLLLLIAVFGFYFYANKEYPKNNFIELTEFQKEIDSLKEIDRKQKKEYAVRPFNPNFISDYKGYVIGLSTIELDRLNKYRDSGHWVNSVEDFKNVTKVSDSLLERISPLFKFPKWKSNKKKRNKNSIVKYPIVSYSKKNDLNTATAIGIQKNIGLPNFIAERIIKYRNKIGGFVDDIQLKDIWGLYDSQRNKILSLYTVKTPVQIHKVNLNATTVKELMTIPYFDFEMAIQIIDFVKDNGRISNFSELGKINGFSLEKLDRIALYLTLN